MAVENRAHSGDRGDESRGKRGHICTKRSTDVHRAQEERRKEGTNTGRRRRAVKKPRVGPGKPYAFAKMTNAE